MTSTDESLAEAEYARWSTASDTRRPLESRVWVCRQDDNGQWIETTSHKRYREAAEACHKQALQAAVKAALSRPAPTGVEEARQALEPFAAEAVKYDPAENDGDRLAWDSRFTVAQIRRARDVLARMPAKTEGCKEVRQDGLAEFARQMIGYAFDGQDADGASIQAFAVQYGLLTETKYDPVKHGPSMEAEPGDSWFEFDGPLAASPAKTEG